MPLFELIWLDGVQQWSQPQQEWWSRGQERWSREWKVEVAAGQDLSVDLHRVTYVI
jgi:hypothetical protein